MLHELVELAKRYEELYQIEGFCGVNIYYGEPTVQLNKKAFLEKFPSGYTFAEREGCEEYPFEYSICIDGVRFFCIFE